MFDELRHAISIGDVIGSNSIMSAGHPSVLITCLGTSQLWPVP